MTSLARTLRQLAQEAAAAEPQAQALKLTPQPRFYEHYLGDAMDFLQPSSFAAYLIRQLIQQLGGAKMGEISSDGDGNKVRQRRSTRRLGIGDVEQMMNEVDTEEDKHVRGLMETAQRRQELRRRFGAIAGNLTNQMVRRIVGSMARTAIRRELSSCSRSRFRVCLPRRRPLTRAMVQQLCQQRQKQLQQRRELMQKHHAEQLQLQ